jgi:hypothetical protein
MTSLTDIITDIRKAMETVEKPLPHTWSVGKMTVAYVEAVQPSNIAAVLDALEKADMERDASKEEARLAWSSDEHQAVWAELKARAEAAEKERDEANRRWSEVCADFISLQKAIVGDSGLSAILRVDALKAAETKLNDLEEWVTEAQIAMREIADTDPVDNMLDPQRPARIARKWLGEEKS